MSKLIISLCIVLSGCATQARMNSTEMNSFTVSKIDCNKEEQIISFLQSQKPSIFEKLMNQLGLGMFRTIADGTFEERQRQSKGYTAAAINGKIQEVRQTCSYQRQLTATPNQFTDGTCYPYGIAEIQNDGHTYQRYDCGGSTKWRMIN